MTPPDGPRLPDPSGSLPDPSGIMALATGYWASAVLFAATRLNVFAALADGPRPAAEVAGACATHPRATTMLLNALVALGLLARDGRGYANTAAARAYLVPGRPTYLGDALRYSQDLYPVWGQLEEAVRTNAPSLAPWTILGEDPEKTRHFVLGMHGRARGVAAGLAAVLDLAGRRHLLDVGGGAGTYSILLVQKTPGLRATVLDLPGVVAIAREIIRASGVGDRIETAAGDYATAPFPPGADALLISGVMHRETPESCRALLRKAHAALAPGGLLVVSDVFFTDEDKIAPPFATLFALNMLLTSEHGSAHAAAEMAAWMGAAGFTGVQTRPLPPPMPHSMLVGTRP